MAAKFASFREITGLMVDNVKEYDNGRGSGQGLR